MDKFYQNLGLKSETKLHSNCPNSYYIQEAVRHGMGKLSKDGALVVETGKHTGRSAKDRYIVKSASTEHTVWWENNLKPMTPKTFAKLKAKVIEYLNGFEDLYITERSVGAHEVHNIQTRLVSTGPQYALFTNHLFREKMRDFTDSDSTILHAPRLEIDPAEFDTRSGTVVVTCFDTNTTIICGTRYAGEIKKSMFAAMNYRLPAAGILPMHSGASKQQVNGETSVFFGLSGTGKTTLSTDEGTMIIGDDEHGLSEEGVFNFEGGCYAKTYQLSKEDEPGIWSATNRFGAMIENVVINDETGEVDYNDKSLTENGRSAYPLSFIKDREEKSTGKIPSHIFFLTADAFGVVPPVSKLTKEQAMFYFVLGYTAKLAGTEIGVTKPTATFSPCFGAPFMLRHPSVYAKLLGEYLDKHDINVWLINTGWTGGPYGEGYRFPIKVTRNIIRAIQANQLNDVETKPDPIFGLQIPVAINGVDADTLQPEKTWSDKNAYTPKSQDLAKSYHAQMKNFGSFYSENIKGAPTYNG
jgi:phosphoenolpyruvate carboxykinase (ATP)